MSGIFGCGLDVNPFASDERIVGVLSDSEVEFEGIGWVGNPFEEFHVLRIVAGSEISGEAPHVERAGRSPIDSLVKLGAPITAGDDDDDDDDGSAEVFADGVEEGVNQKLDIAFDVGRDGVVDSEAGGDGRFFELGERKLAEIRVNTEMRAEMMSFHVSGDMLF